MVWDLFFSDHGYLVLQREREQYRILQEEIRQLKAEQADLKRQIIRLREDKNALEEAIRRELGYVYPDEYMLIMPKRRHNKADTVGKKEEKQ